MPEAPPATSFEDIDASLQRLRAGAARWIALPIAAKRELLSAVRARTAEWAGRWTAAAASAKGIADTPLAGEEATSGPWALIRGLGLYLQTLREIEEFGAPRIDPRHIRHRPDGQLILDVFPNDGYDRMLLGGVRAEVWFDPQVDEATLNAGAGSWYRRADREPRVTVVLGAGNIASIAPLDVLYQLLADGAVCILKLNPVNAYVGPIFENIFEPLVKGGFLEFAYGGAEVGAYLCEHRGVDAVHITGSEITHDRIAFGSGEDGARRKAANQPLLRKPITSELGNVSPTIVIPGDWSAADFRFQAEHLASQKLHNDGFNCVASQVLILPAEWGGTPKLIAALERVLADLADRPAYYPGAVERCERFAREAKVERFGRNDASYTPRTLMHIDPTANTDALRVEAFSSALAILTLPGSMPAYLHDAVRFANDRLWGTLGANLIVHPADQRRHARDLDAAIANLRYGCVGVNIWTGAGFLLCETPWGAFPGHTLDDVRSGIGVVHNAHLLEGTQKSVVYGPFAPFPRGLLTLQPSLLPKPPWFVTHRNAAAIGAELCAFEMHKTPWHLAKIAALAMTG